MSDRTPLFILLGASTATGLAQREHALAEMLVRRGYPVRYIPIPRSVAYRVREGVRTIARTRSVESGAELPIESGNFLISVPPTLPTYTKSSLTPEIDTGILRRWFVRQVIVEDWRNTVVLIMTPYWWGTMIDERNCPAACCVYDLADVHEVASRTPGALARLKTAERALASHVHLATHSAHTLGEYLEEVMPDVPRVLMTNAVRSDYIRDESVHVRTAKRKIGYLGTLNSRWIDLGLLKRIASRFPTMQVEIIAPVTSEARRRLMKLDNVTLTGAMPQTRAMSRLRDWDVALIPFRESSITRVVNPLKLYEYCAAGLPVVARRTPELEYYSPFYHGAVSDEDFLHLVQSALDEDSETKRRERIAFAKENTWEKRVDLLLQSLPTGLS